MENTISVDSVQAENPHTDPFEPPESVLSTDSTPPTESPLLTAALAYAARGWPVVPHYSIDETGRCTCRLTACTNAGKHPRTRHGIKDATTDPAKIRRWWRQWPQANIAIATGKPSGFDALDIDPPKGGDASLGKLPSLPDTVVQLSGGGGYHYLFVHRPGLKNGVDLLPGIDLKTTGGMIIVAPSLHQSGQRYTWEPSSRPGDVELAAWPEAVLDGLGCLKTDPSNSRPKTTGGNGSTAYGKKALADEAATVESAKPGSQETTLNTAAFNVGQLVAGDALDEMEAFEVLVDAAQRMENEPGKPPWTTEVIEKKVQHGLDDGRQHPRSAPPPLQLVQTATETPAATTQGFNHTDLGNAERLVALHGENIRYCYPAKSWYIWDGQRWTPDHAGRIATLAQETVRSIYAEASQTEDDGERKALVKHGQRSENGNRLAALIGQAQNKVAVQPEDLDTLPWILNCANGTLNLKTSELYAPRRTDLLTKISPVAFDAGADCPLWLSFLDRIMGGNQDLIQFLRRAIGYSLTGSTREQCLFLLHGLGANGKSTFLETVEKLMGEYGQQSDFSTFLVKRNQEGPRNDIARLKGARFVAATEAEGGARLSEVVVKQLSGGDTVAARFLHQEFFEFKPEFKIWLGTNHKPIIRGTDNAIWRRIRLIPFTVTIPPKEQDRDLPAKLRDELPGILTWALTGCLEWREEGLGEPDEVREATAEYRVEMDVLGEFLDACCIVQANAESKSAELYKVYKEWSEDGGNRPMSQRAFGQALSERGIGRRRGTGNVQMRVGVGLRLASHTP